MLNFKNSIKIISPQHKKSRTPKSLLHPNCNNPNDDSKITSLGSERPLRSFENHIRKLLSFSAPQNPSLSVNNQAHSQQCQKSQKAHHKLQPQKSPAPFSHTQRKQQVHYITPFPKRWEQTRSHTLLQGCVD